MSRLPRSLEHLKTGFTAEAVSAASFRAYAARAERDGKPNLARRWQALAEEKDALAIRQLEAADRVSGDLGDVAAALAEERYENDVLYPRLAAGVDGAPAALFEGVAAAQRVHAERLERLREELTGSAGDVADEGGG